MNVVKVWVRLAVSGLVTALFLAAPFTYAEKYTGGSYQIDASITNSFGDATSSTNYKMVSSGGESVIGNGTGGSYTLGVGYVAQLQNGMQLSVQPNGLVAHYCLDEASGTATYDSSVNENNGLLQSGATWGTGKLDGGADTTSGDVQIADNAALPTGQAMTIELWAKQSSSATSKAFLTQWDYSGGVPTSAGWALETSSSDASKLRFVVGGSADDTESKYVDTPADAWPSGFWHHISVVYDGTKSTASERVKIYVDGIVTEGTMTGTIPSSLQNSSSYLDIGEFRGLNRKFNGIIDNVKIFNRALSSAEIKADYDAQSVGESSGVNLGELVAGTSNTALYDAIIQTDAFGYELAVNQNQDLTSGSNTIDAISGTIASPISWVESTTKGLGFTLVDTNATAIPGKWSSGSAYAAFPGTLTSFYTRTGQQAAKDYLNMRLRVDVPSGQADGSYANTITTTGTITP